MIYPVFCMRDLKVGFLSPTVDQNDQTAIRNFSYAVNGNNSMMNYSPGDFQLYKVGTFDSQKGTILPLVPIELVAEGVNVYEK